MEEASSKVGVVLYGLGHIGCMVAQLVLKRRRLEIRGAIDIDKDMVGRDIGELFYGDRIGLRISNNAREVLHQSRAQIVLHSTTSSLVQIMPQISEALKAGLNVISTSEELSFPYLRYAKLSEEIDRLAKEHSVTILGTGINPGFVMDTLPITLMGACQEVNKIVVKRSIDASLRRSSFQRKIGAGLTIGEFNEKLKKGAVGHLGLPESTAMIASSVGLRLDDINETMEPLLSDEYIKNKFATVEPGKIFGIIQKGFGVRNGESVIELEFEAYLGNENPLDYICIEGNPRIELTIEGGIHGDLATAAIVVNMIPRVIDADPGLITMKDLPPPSSMYD